MIIKEIGKRLWFLSLLVALLAVSCSKDNEDTGQNLIEKHGLAGNFTAQISPSFMGTNPITSGEHVIHFEDIGNGQLRMHFEKFRADPMPFEMSVDIVLQVKSGDNNSIILEGKNGQFNATPPNGTAIDPNDIPDGIQLPDGAENGLSSQQANASGRFALLEKDGKTAWRYDLNVSPGLPLPIEVIIYTKP